MFLKTLGFKSCTFSYPLTSLASSYLSFSNSSLVNYQIEELIFDRRNLTFLKAVGMTASGSETCKVASDRTERSIARDKPSSAASGGGPDSEELRAQLRASSVKVDLASQQVVKEWAMLSASKPKLVANFRPS
jgi:hypothetical protein